MGQDEIRCQEMSNVPNTFSGMDIRPLAGNSEVGEVWADLVVQLQLEASLKTECLKIWEESTLGICTAILNKLRRWQYALNSSI